MHSYLFYDIETTGLNKAFDQVLQFAAIRTDMKLKETDRHNIMVKLRPDVIPSPRAMITHRISITDSISGICELEAVKQIHRLMNTPGTISLGYNTLAFDDEFLRFSFYRNLLPPYTHQYDNGCSRMDLFPMTILYRLYKRDILIWPEIDGKPTLKLEHLSKANRLASGQAHDALVDVEATVELARRFYKEHKMWDYLVGYFNKGTDRSRIENLAISFQNTSGKHCKALMVSGEYGSKQKYQVPALSIGDSIPYSNQSLWLRLDQPHLRDATPETIPDKTWVIRKKYGETPIVLPPLDRYLKFLSREQLSTAKKNQHWLKSRTELFQKIITYHREFKYPVIDDLDVDAALYQNGFLSREEQKLCHQFHMAPLTEKAQLLEDFANTDTRKLAVRVICRNYPLEDLPTERAKYFGREFEDYLRRVNPTDNNDALLDYKGERRTTPSDALLEISRLRNEPGLDRMQIQSLDDLTDYIKNNF
jgi:exodeoxyribonuclease-1